jgi:hypothetical protein
MKSKKTPSIQEYLHLSRSFTQALSEVVEWGLLVNARTIKIELRERESSGEQARTTSSGSSSLNAMAANIEVGVRTWKLVLSLGSDWWWRRASDIGSTCWSNQWLHSSFAL